MDHGHNSMNMNSTSMNGNSMMSGTFHTGTLDGWLFSAWVPQSNAAYAALWLGIFFISIIHQVGFRAICERIVTKRINHLHGKVVVVSIPREEKSISDETQVFEINDVISSKIPLRSNNSNGINPSRTSYNSSESPNSHNDSNIQMNDTCNSIEVVPFRLSVDIPRATFAFLESVFGYALMLAVMTFNIGYFFAVTGGVFVGELLFGRFLLGPKLGH